MPDKSLAGETDPGGSYADGYADGRYAGSVKMHTVKSVSNMICWI